MNTTTQNTVRAAAILLCSAITLCTLQISARAADAPPSRKVSYADLDVSTPAGAKVLYGRIQSAAKQVCQYNGFQTLGTLQMVNRCIDSAIDKAVKDVGSPALSALRKDGPLHLASK